MTIQWGGWSGHLRVGIEVAETAYDTWTPSIDVHVRTFVQCDGSFNFSDNQTVTLSGSVGATYDFYNGLQANQSVQVGTYIIYGQAQSFGGGPSYYFQANLSGAYNGAAPSVGVNYSLPPRPTRPPAPPSPGPIWSDIRADYAWLDWGGSPDYGGLNPDQDNLQVSANSAFTALVHDTYLGSTASAVTSLAPQTTYWSRSRVHNAAGWSGWSATTTGRTNDFLVTGLAVSNLGPDSADLTWVKPDTTPDPSRYSYQIATDSNFTNIVQSADVATWATTRTFSSLVPGTKYWARVRAGTPQGWGVWTAGVALETLSGAKVRKGNVWVDAPVFVRIGGQWKVAKVNKRVNGKWVL